MSAQARTAAAATSAGFSGGVLYAVSCTSRSQCTATGMESTRSGKNTKTLAERWNGTTWAVQSTATPTSRTLLGGALAAGVSCTSSTACVADGFSYTKKSTQLLGEGWNGRTWTSQADAAPVVAADPAGLSCTWAKDCMAVGARLSGMTLAEHWNGRKWSALTTKHDGALESVSCPATGNCTAVGSNNAGKALAAHWNGKAWSDQSAASSGQLTLLAGVSCPAAKDCVAVGTGGTVTSSALDLAPVAEQWTGGKWAVLTVPDPAPAGDLAELNSVSCTSATTCMAVGDYIDQARHDRHGLHRAAGRPGLDGPDHAQRGHVQRARVGVLQLAGALRRGRGQQRHGHRHHLPADRGLERQRLDGRHRPTLTIHRPARPSAAWPDLLPGRATPHCR